jgi:hypothetical protein
MVVFRKYVLNKYWLILSIDYFYVTSNKCVDKGPVPLSTRIYALTNARKNYIFIFARNKKEAIQHFIKTFHQKPIHCAEVLLDYEIMRGNEVITFRELRKEYDSFPVLIGGLSLTTLQY